MAEKSYWPMLCLLQQLLEQHEDFRFALSLSGVFVEQIETWDQPLLALLQELAKYDRVEFLGETYYHSLAALYDPTEFREQVLQHRGMMQRLFGRTPTTFRNTELIYQDDIARHIEALEFDGVLTEAVTRYLGHRPKTQLYRSPDDVALPIMLKHAELSDDLAFRFSDRNWAWYPLHADQYVRWLHQYHHDDFINLFMDFETFGEHQWADTGIFQFFKEMVAMACAADDRFVMPREVFGGLSTRQRRALELYHVSEPISWADVDRDLTAWVDNAMQRDSLQTIYSYGDRVLQSGDDDLIHTWRKLQTSDHFYYMCTKWAADGDVHAYFSPYDSPYEAYRKYSVALSDMYQRLYV